MVFVPDPFASGGPVCVYKCTRTNITADFLLEALSDVMAKLLNNRPLQACSKRVTLSTSFNHSGCPQKRFDWLRAVLTIPKWSCLIGATKSGAYELLSTPETIRPSGANIKNEISKSSP
jgi:hypothetical protein